ncbi:hypothetical protein ACUY3Q_20545, partial [Xanthomonas arboricola pv. corylina]
EKEACPCGRDSEAKVPFRGPALVEKTPCMPHKAFWRNGIRMYGTDEHQQAMAELHSLNDGALADVRLLA